MTEKKSEETTALALAPSTDMAAYDYGDDTIKERDIREFLLPMLVVLQSTSPEINKKESRVDGAVPGMFFDRSTGKKYDGDKGIEVVASIVKRCFVEWTPVDARDDGSKGTLVDGRPKGRTFEVDDPVVLQCKATAEKLGREFNDLRLPDTDNDLIETYYIYGINIDQRDPFRWSPFVTVITSKKLSHFRKFWGQWQRVTLPNGKYPPDFAHAFRIQTWEDKDKKGRPFQNVKFTSLFGSFENSMLLPTSPAYIAAKMVAENVRKGLWRLDDGAETGAHSPSAPAGSDIPAGPADDAPGEGEGNGLF